MSPSLARRSPALQLVPNAVDGSVMPAILSRANATRPGRLSGPARVAAFVQDLRVGAADEPPPILPGAELQHQDRRDPGDPGLAAGEGRAEPVGLRTPGADDDLPHAVRAGQAALPSRPNRS